MITMKNKAIFLDRDGVVTYDPDDYTYRLEDIFILEGIVPFCKAAVKRGYKIIVITNQGGISKGLYEKKDVDVIHDYIESEFKKEGIPIEEFYFCPHHNKFENCLCRKPDSLLVEKALYKYNVDPSKSYFIGDKWRDVECGEKVGVNGIKIDVNKVLPTLINQIA